MDDDAIWTLGMMSGTSMDGVDAAMVRTDGECVVDFGPSHFRPYAPAERAELKRAAAWAASGEGSEAWRAAATIVTEAHAEAAEALLRDATAAHPLLIGFHGQTLLHAPDRGRTLQIGDAAALAKRLDVDVAWEFRVADVAAGGQGAPFAPFYHHALARKAGLDAPVAFLNLGGVGNVTWADPRIADPSAPGALIAFDTGPANALVDDFVAARAGMAFDADGALAAAGRVDADLVASWMADPYFSEPAPKSLDRDRFVAALSDVEGFSVEDGAATLSAFTVASVAAAAAATPQSAARWFACGGGRRNAALTAAISSALGVALEPVEALGYDGDMIEAQAFGHLAARVQRGLALSAPGTTGAPRPIVGGRIARAA